MIKILTLSILLLSSITYASSTPNNYIFPVNTANIVGSDQKHPVTADLIEKFTLECDYLDFYKNHIKAHPIHVDRVCNTMMQKREIKYDAPYTIEKFYGIGK